jgi:hypothetical protein
MRNSEKPLAYAHLNIAAAALAHSRKPSVAPVAALVAAFVAVQNDFVSLQLSIRSSKSIQGQLSRKKTSVSSCSLKIFENVFLPPLVVSASRKVLGVVLWKHRLELATPMSEWPECRDLECETFTPHSIKERILQHP